MAKADDDEKNTSKRDTHEQGKQPPIKLSRKRRRGQKQRSEGPGMFGCLSSSEMVLQVGRMPASSLGSRVQRFLPLDTCKCI